MKNVAIIIPAFNEEKSLTALLNEIDNLETPDFNLISLVVNDASTDNTLQILESNNCNFLDLPVNLGIGGAVQSGLIWAYQNDFDYAIQVDGDGQHPPSEIPILLEAISDLKSNVIIGSRFLNNEGFQSTALRRFGITYLKYLNKLLTSKTIHDSTSGFRVFDKKAISLCAKNYPDEYPEPVSIIIFLKNDLKIEEVAVKMKEREFGQTSIKSFKQLYYIIKVSLAIFYNFIKSK